MGVGLVIGLIKGLLVTRTSIPSLSITIGTMFGTMGLTLGFTELIAGSTRDFMTPGALPKALLGTFVGMFQVTIFWWLAFIGVVFYALHISPWGNWIFALGGDRDSARNAGISTARVTIGLYMASGFAAAFVGVAQVITFGSAQVAAGAASLGLNWRDRGAR